MGEKSETKKKLLIGFDLSIPRQKKVYEFLCRKKEETGIAYNIIIHEALDIYMHYLDSLEPAKLFSDSSYVKKSEQKDKLSVVHKKQAEKKESPMTESNVQKSKSSESILSDADIEDPYLVGLINNNYGNET